MKKNYIKEETIDRMRADEGLLLEFFREYISVSVSQNPNSLFQILYFSNKKNNNRVLFFNSFFMGVLAESRKQNQDTE